MDDLSRMRREGAEAMNVDQFREAIRSAGLEPPESIEPDGRLHRFASNGRVRDDAGWYVFHADGIPAGAFGDWRSGIKKTWHANIGRPLTTAEKSAHRARAKNMERKVRERAETARQDAARTWEGAPVVDAHPYLTSKGIRSHGLRSYRASLLVPVFDNQGDLQTLEFISPTGAKSSYPGCRKTGHYLLGEVREGPLAIAEGYASAATVHEVTGMACAVSFGDAGLLPAAKSLRQKYPKVEMVIVGDDDYLKDGNPGRTAATAAAEEVGAHLVFPDFTGVVRGDKDTDINDMCRLRGAEVVRALLIYKKEGRKCKDDSESNEESRLDAVAIHVVSGDPPTQRARPQTDILIDIGLNVSKALFCGDDDRPYAVIRDRSEVWGIASKRFREWLRGCYFKHVGKGANSNAIRDAIETISAKAQFSGDKRRVFLRTAEADGKLYVDLTDDEWRVVEIDATGWCVLDNSPVMFVRRGAPAPLPAPVHGGSLKTLWPLINVSEKYRPLVVGWLLAALRVSGPYPILLFQGEEGTAKSTVARMLRFLCDPSLVPLRAPTRDERDFLVGAVGNWCVCIDNVSDLQPWMSDALCRLSTGGGFAARTLYTDCDETAIQIQRPVILNGIDVGAVRGDLVSRVIAVPLSPNLRGPETAREGVVGPVQGGRAARVRSLPYGAIAGCP